jgi:hypothetical protein
MEEPEYYYWGDKYYKTSSMTYQLVGYSWDHWANKEISRVTGAEINHVAIRFNAFKTETYVSHKKTDVIVPSKVVTRLHGKPVWKGKKVRVGAEFINKALKWTTWWQGNEPGSIWRCYAHHYIGRHIGLKSPWTCTKLCQRILREDGMLLKADFYPHELVREYIKRRY